MNEKFLNPERTAELWSAVKKYVGSHGGTGAGETSFLVKAPLGTIVIWSGAADNIPSGWQLCDGTNGTPDLRERFVVGAGSAYSVGDTGGSETVRLTLDEMPAHTHSIPYNKAGNSTYTSVMLDYTTSLSNKLLSYDAIGNSGSDQPHENRPPYYALCYIMKLTADETDSLPVAAMTQAEYEALSEEEKQDDTVRIITDDSPPAGESSPSPSLDVYSTEETRIGTWIDGKPIYRIVLSGTTGSNTTIADTTPLAIETVVSVHGIVKNKNGYVYPVPNNTSSGYISIYLTTRNETVNISTSIESLTSRPITIILEYTKTTDQPEVTS